MWLKGQGFSVFVMLENPGQVKVLVQPENDS